MIKLVFDDKNYGDDLMAFHYSMTKNETDKFEKYTDSWRKNHI